MPLFKPQLRVDDEGVLQGYVGEMDFVGAGVAVVVVGNIATVTIAGGGNTIYSGDGTIAGARAVALNSNAVAFNQGAEPFFKIDPTANAETTFIRAFNTTGSDNYGRVVTSTSATNGQAFLEASFNGGAKIGGITVIADATSARCTYIALTHIFTGGVSLVNDIDVATAGTRWGSQSFAASGEFPACALIGSYSGSVTIFPSYSSVTVGSKVIIGYWSGAVRSAFEVANVASGNGVAYIMKTGGNVGIGVAATTARLHLPAGSATASTGPLKFTSGTLLGTTEAGAIEFDGTHLYFTAANAGTRYQLDQQGGGTTIYSGDGSLAANRTVDLNGKLLHIAQGANDFLTIDPTVNAEVAALLAYNITGSGNLSGIVAEASDINSQTSLNAVFNGGAKLAGVTADVTSTTAGLTYNADTHTFNIPAATADATFGVTDGSNYQLLVDATPGSESSIIVAYNITDGGNSGGFFGTTSDNEGSAELVAEFDGGAKSAIIAATANATTATLTYTADTHTFNIPLSTGIFKVTDSGNDLINVDVPNVETTIKANDGTANSFVRVRGAAASALFTLDADNGSGSNVGIEGDAGAESITYTAGTHTFTGGEFFVNGNSVGGLISIVESDFESQIKAGDGTASSYLDLNGDLGGTLVNFNLTSFNGTNTVSIAGNSIAQTITLTSATTIVSNLAGTGSRAVLADATGTLSAPISDFSVKENVMDLTYGLDILSKLRPVSFMFKDDWKRYGEGMQIGFIAQEIESILPNSVFTTPSNGKMGFNSDDLIAVLVKSVQDQQAHIERLEKQISMN